MNILIKSSNGITTVPADSKLLDMGNIFIEGEINSETACTFIKELMIRNSLAPGKPVNVLINSPGGEINAGLCMYDAIQASKVPVRMFCMGMAYSMAAVLFACGNDGRYMLPHSELMLHEPLLGNRVGGNSSSIKSISDSLMEIKHTMNEILAKHTGKTEEEIEKETSFDHYFSPEESVAFGLCDEIGGMEILMEDLF